VNLGKGQFSRLFIFKGQDHLKVVESFGKAHNLSKRKRDKLLSVIETQIKSERLSAIDEEDHRYRRQATEEINEQI